jgi:hypothetical protein
MSEEDLVLDIENRAVLIKSLKVAYRLAGSAGYRIEGALTYVKSTTPDSKDIRQHSNHALRELRKLETLVEALLKSCGEETY